MNRIQEKINEIRNFVSELDEIKPSAFEDYNSNKMLKAACERYIEKIVEGITDIAFLVIKSRKFEVPEDDVDAFRILLLHKVITEPLSAKLKEAKGMRNIIALQYGRIDDNIVFMSLADLQKDAEKFIKEISKQNTKSK